MWGHDHSGMDTADMYQILKNTHYVCLMRLPNTCLTQHNFMIGVSMLCSWKQWHSNYNPFLISSHLSVVYEVDVCIMFASCIYGCDLPDMSYSFHWKSVLWRPRSSINNMLYGILSLGWLVSLSITKAKRCDLMRIFMLAWLISFVFVSPTVITLVAVYSTCL